MRYTRRTVHLVLAALDSKDALRRELDAAFPGRHAEVRPGMFACHALDLPAEAGRDPGEARSAIALPSLAFARQIVPGARAEEARSIRIWAELVVHAVAGVLPDQQPWALHIYPFREVLDTSRMGARAWHSRARAGEPLPGQAGARAEHTTTGPGHHRCRLVREATVELLQKRRRHLLRHLRQEPETFAPDETLVQLVLTSPDQGYLSIAPAPVPFENRRALSFFPGGEVALAKDERAPSRAFAKLLEAEARLGRRIGAREACVDLGASPGSWTYVAARRGARVIAVDRSELRPDLMQHRSVRFQRGDAFRFEPAEPVDWFLCDVIAAAERTADLLLLWLRRRWCRHFVVTLKVDDEGSNAVLSKLAHELPELTQEFWLLRLCANKKEVCAFGTSVPR